MTSTTINIARSDDPAGKKEQKNAPQNETVAIFCFDLTGFTKLNQFLLCCAGVVSINCFYFPFNEH